MQETPSQPLSEDKGNVQQISCLLHPSANPSRMVLGREIWVQIPTFSISFTSGFFSITYLFYRKKRIWKYFLYVPLYVKFSIQWSLIYWVLAIGKERSSLTRSLRGLTYNLKLQQKSKAEHFGWWEAEGTDWWLLMLYDLAKPYRS